MLVGGGDPTLTVGADGSYPGAARLDELAKQVKAAAGAPVTSVVVRLVAVHAAPRLAPAGTRTSVAGGTARR